MSVISVHICLCVCGWVSEWVGGSGWVCKRMGKT